MPKFHPKPISAAERAARQRRAARVARRLGFVGRVEYRHVYSQTGGAQYGLAVVAERDLLIVDAEAFERNANPDDFSLEAILAHERGHQVLARHPRLARNLPSSFSLITEEIVASLAGSLIVEGEADQQSLLLKALFEADKQGLPLDRATSLLMELRSLLEKIL